MQAYSTKRAILGFMDIEHTYDCTAASMPQSSPPLLRWSGRSGTGLMDSTRSLPALSSSTTRNGAANPSSWAEVDQRGVVSTGLPTRQEFGAFSAMPSAQGNACSQAIWTPGHFDRYREVSALVMQILVDETLLRRPRLHRRGIL